MKPLERFKKSIKKHQISSRIGKGCLAFMLAFSCIPNMQTASAATSLKPEATLSVAKGLSVDFSSAGLNKIGYIYNMSLDGKQAFCMDLGKHASSGVTFARIGSKTNSVYNSIYNYFLKSDEVTTLLGGTTGTWNNNKIAATSGAIWAYEEGLSTNADDSLGLGLSPAGKILQKVIEAFGGITLPSVIYTNMAKESRAYSSSGTLYIYDSGRNSDQRLITSEPGEDVTLREKDLRETATASHTFDNQVQVTKTDVESNGTLQGAQFDFYRNGTKFGSATTNANGIASATSEYTISRSATSSRFSYVETNAKSKYNLDNIEGRSEAEARALAKADAQKKAKAAAQEAVADTRLEFYAIETSSRAKYWLNPNNKQTTTITKTGSGNVSLGTLTNTRQKGTITLTKTDNETGNPLSGAIFKLYARNDIVHPDGKTGVIYSAGQEVATFPITNASGKTTLNNLYLGDYYVKEVKAPNLYILNSSSQNISLTDKGKNVEISVSTSTIQNAHQTGQITVIKHDTETDMTVPGSVYTLYAKSKIYHPDGSGRVLYNVNDKVADFPATSTAGTSSLNGLYLGEYYIKEKTAPNGYLLSNEQYNVTLTYAGQNATVSTLSQKVTDKVVRGNIFFEKFDKNLYENTDNASIVDSNKDGAQGDATRKGATYGLYAARDIIHKDTKTGVVKYNQNPGNIHEIKLTKGTDLEVKNVNATAGTLLATAKTDQNGQIEFSHLYLGDYYIKEIEPSEGYLLDTTRYYVSINYAGQTVAVVNTSTDVLEQVKKQGFEIFKLGHQSGTSGVGKPLSGVVFEIKLESDVQRLGWDKAPLYDRVTTVLGKAVTKDLPHGYYRGREVKPAPNYNTAEDFFVNITQDSRTPLNTIEANTNIIDEIYTSLLKVAKLDADSGKTIVIQGTEFKIKALEDVYVGDKLFKAGEYIGYWNRNLFPKYEESWTTNSEGYIYLQEKLGAGKYQLEEIHAAKPYVLGIVKDGEIINNPIEFEITNTGDNDKFEDTNNDVTYVTVSDTPVKGQINVEKRGEVLVNFVNGQFIYEERGLSNAKFNITAKENIMDPSGDRTILHKKGALVTTITTNSQGKAQTELLPLGKYTITEVKAPEGMVLNSKSQDVELKYANENTPVVFDSATFTNERQKVKLDLMKYDSDNDVILPNAEITMFANKDIMNYDGNVIVKKGTAIQTVLSNNKGEIIFDLDLPVYLTDLDIDEGEFPDPFGLTLDKDEEGDIVIGNEKSLFYVKETKQPDGYVSHHFKYMIDTAYQGQNQENITIAYNINNEITKIDVSKTDLTTGKDVIGAHMTWTDKETGEVVDSWITDGTLHRIEGDKAIVGKTYILTEILPADGYVTAESIEFTVQDTAEIQKVEMKDDHTRIDFDKVDIVSGEPVIGTELRIIPLDENGNLKEGEVFETWITNDSTHRVEYLPIGDYVLRERLQGQALDYGYVTAEDIKFTVKDTGVVQKIEMKDDFTKLEITKTDIVTGNPVPGAELSIIPVKEDGTLDLGATFDTWITEDGEDNVHYIERIPVGKYVLRENLEQASVLGYVTANDIEFEVKDTGVVQKINMKDDFTHTEFTKVDVNGKAVAGATMSIVPLDEDGNYVMGNSFDTWLTVADDPTTQEDESIHSVEYLPIGRYALIELSAPDGYVKALPVEFEVKDTSDVQKFTMVEKQVSCTKYNVTGTEEVPGAEIEVHDKDGNIVDKWTSTEEPHYISGLEEGKDYILIEVVAPDEYVVAEAIEFTVTTEKENQNVNMLDKQVEVSKQDIVTGEELPGAELIVTDKETGEVIDKWISGDKPHYVSGLKEGKTYILTEKTAPEGFYVAESIEFTVSYDKVNQKVIMKDAPILTDVQINKINSKTKELITDSQALFNVYADESCKELIGSGYTLNGVVTFTQMRYGTYYIKEIQAPTGYELSNQIIKLVINDETEGVGEIHTINFENTPITRIRTGDDSNAAMYGTLGLVALAGMVATRKKKETESE